MLSDLIQAAQHTKLLSNRRLIVRAIGISERTLQRWLKVPSTRLTPEHGIQFLRLIAVFARVEAMFGSGIKAERWLCDPAMGLERRIPIDLLRSRADYELLATFLIRLEYGVYH
ncbi:putative toxin-antitoxin system antitoxin component [compost metagenome]